MIKNKTSKLRLGFLLFVLILISIIYVSKSYWQLFIFEPKEYIKQSAIAELWNDSFFGNLYINYERVSIEPYKIEIISTTIDLKNKNYIVEARLNPWFILLSMDLENKRIRDPVVAVLATIGLGEEREYILFKDNFGKWKAKFK